MDALEAGLDGHSNSTPRGTGQSDWFQVQEVLPKSHTRNAFSEGDRWRGSLPLKHGNALNRILETGADPTHYTRELKYLCIRGQLAR